MIRGKGLIRPPGGARIIHPNSKMMASRTIPSTSVKSKLPSLKNSSRPSSSESKKHTPRTPVNQIGESYLGIKISLSAPSFAIPNLTKYDTEPGLSNINNSEMLKILVERCEQCCIVINFNDPNNKQIISDKTASLSDICSVVSHKSNVSLFGTREYQALLKLFLKNVVRAPSKPPPLQYWITQIDYDDSIQEKSWDHIKLVYEIIITLISNRKFNPKLCPETELKMFLGGVVTLFASNDSRERDRVGRLYSACYAAIPFCRSNLRNHATSFLTQSFCSGIPPFGVAELLKALDPITEKMNTPLLHENYQFFRKVLLPLHMTEQLKRFHTPLVIVMFNFCEKDSALALEAIQYLLHFWPIQCTLKHKLFFVEIERLMCYLEIDECNCIVDRLVHFLAEDVNSDHYTLAEDTNNIFKGESIVKLVAKHAERTYPVLLPEMTKAANSHWHEDARKAASRALDILKSMDEDSFTASAFGSSDTEEHVGFERWEKIARMADPSDAEKLIEEMRKKYI